MPSWEFFPSEKPVWWWSVVVLIFPCWTPQMTAKHSKLRHWQFFKFRSQYVDRWFLKVWQCVSAWSVHILDSDVKLVRIRIRSAFLHMKSYHCVIGSRCFEAVWWPENVGEQHAVTNGCLCCTSATAKNSHKKETVLDRFMLDLVGESRSQFCHQLTHPENLQLNSQYRPTRL